MAEAGVDILRIGAQGDGIADTPQGPQFVPFALPGERVNPVEAGLPEIVSAPSPDRAEPVCRHFGICGGCVAQHMSDALYADWKRNLVVEAFRQRGIACQVAPLLRVPQGSRRRAVFTARRRDGAVVLGYHRRRSHDLFQVEECPVLQPAIVARLDTLRVIAQAVASRGDARITVLATPGGLDIAVDVERPPEPSAVARLGRVAAEQGVARLAINGDPVLVRVSPALAVGGIEMAVPPGAFLQAVAEAEIAIASRVVAALGKARRVADLFCGIGTLTFPLARQAGVLAVDADKPSIHALAEAARRTQGLKPIETRVRDLFRDPLSSRELDGFGAVVLDPPRAGARAQSEALARSKVATVIAVSCNPATLARDARTLIDGGYRVESVTPIDQFLYAAHVEVVAVLRRA